MKLIASLRHLSVRATRAYEDQIVFPLAKSCLAAADSALEIHVRRGERPAACGYCDSQQVYPIDLWCVSDTHVALEQRCPGCERQYVRVFTISVANAYQDLMQSCEDDIERSLFEVEAERFSLELTNGTVQPADFATYEGDDD
jgi:hypothetical protein